jgi:GT2 family glycosyltransferase
MIAEHCRYPSFLRLSRSAAEHTIAHETTWVIGSFVVCRRAALDAVGWFDESIFLFGEDEDLSRRLRRNGWEVWYAPVGSVEHQSGHSWRQLRDEGRKLSRQARARALSAERGALQADLYRALCAVSDGVARLRRRTQLAPLVDRNRRLESSATGRR